MTRSIRWLASVAFLLVLLAPAGAQAETPPLLRQFCEGQHGPNAAGAGQCVIPRGIAVNQTSGDAFVANQNNLRAERFTAWGEMLRAWGWDVVQSGPGDDTTAPEDEFEICVPANGDVCKEGVAGGGDGEFATLQGVAVDSAGDVYVVDRNNHRVQKFDPDGNFLLTFGGDVNKTKAEALAPEAERNICPVDPGDVCQAGTEGTGNGQFGAWAVGSYIAIDRGSPDIVYVGDEERIQKFDVDGGYLGEIALPEAGVVGGLAVDDDSSSPNSGDLYFFYVSQLGPYPSSEAVQPDVHRLDPVTGSEVGEPLKVDLPGAIATGGGGNVYVFGKTVFVSSGDPQNHPSRVLQFDSAGDLIDVFLEGEFSESTGIATSTACGIDGEDLFISNGLAENSFIRLYGPPPDINVCPPPKVPPTIEDQHALSVDTDGALVRAKINPHFWPDTSYYVEYGTGKCSEAGCDKLALFPGAQLGAGIKDAFFTTKGVFLGAEEPLTPDTTYHYRFVSESELSEAGATIAEEGTFRTFPVASEPKADCPNQQFRTGASANLPDCRAYELVSPLDKNNADISRPSEALDLSSPDGEALTYATLTAAYGDPAGAPFAHQYMSTRDAAQGWQTRSISAPKKLPLLYNVGDVAGFGSEFKAFSEDLCSGWMVQDVDLPLAAGAPGGVPNLYRRDNCGPDEGTYELLTSVFPPGYGKDLEPEESSYYLNVQGYSADESMTVLRAPAKLTDNANPTKGLLQLYAHSEGQLHLVSARPNGNAATADSSAGTMQGAGAVVVKEDSVKNAVSEDGDRIFWSERKAGGDTLYVRVHPLEPQSDTTFAGKCTEPEKACTLLIANTEALLKPHFHTAAPDGSVAIYQFGGGLFEYDVAKALANETASTQIATGVSGVMGASEDATRIYFVSEDDLDGGGEAEAGKHNLYLYEKGVGTRFVVTGTSDGDSLQAPKSPSNRRSRVSADGLHLAFTSTAPLTGYDNADASSGQPDTEVFLYDASANGGVGELVCASCNPSGARPAGRQVGSSSGGQITFWAAARLPTWINQFHPGRFLADDGSRLFFESFDALVNRDTNGKQDVYEWERAEDAKECEEQIGGELFVPESGGCLSLISSGEGKEDAELVDASAHGLDVFFATESSLLVQDFGLRDIYDAREGGGFPPPAVPPPGCEGEACQGTASTPENPTPASAAYQGPGNVSEGAKPRPHCPKGKRRVRRAGKARCVKRQKRASKKANRQQRRAVR